MKKLLAILGVALLAGCQVPLNEETTENGQAPTTGGEVQQEEQAAPATSPDGLLQEITPAEAEAQIQAEAEAQTQANPQAETQANPQI